MRKLMLVTVMVLVTVILPMSVLADADRPAPQRLDKATIAAMSVAELEAKSTQLRAVKDYAGAKPLLQEATRRQPKNAVLFNKLGMVELQLREMDAALNHFSKATKLNSKYPEALNNVGTVYFLRGNYDTAAKYYRKALALDETRAVFHANLAAAWISRNKLNLALTEYARALELDPDVLVNSAATGIAAQVSTPEQRANRFFLLARVFAIRGDVNSALDFLKKAKEEGYRDLDSVYKQKEFANLWQDQRLAELVPPAKGK